MGLPPLHYSWLKELVAVIGRIGSGKTTFLQTIIGELYPLQLHGCIMRELGHEAELSPNHLEQPHENILCIEMASRVCAFGRKEWLCGGSGHSFRACGLLLPGRGWQDIVAVNAGRFLKPLLFHFTSW